MSDVHILQFQDLTQLRLDVCVLIKFETAELESLELCSVKNTYTEYNVQRMAVLKRLPSQ